MGIFDAITTVSLRFTNDKIDRIAGDTIPLDSIFEMPGQDTLEGQALDNIRTEITLTLTHAFVRTTTPSRIDRIVTNNMPLYIKNNKGSHRGLWDLKKLQESLQEFVLSPADGEFIIYVDCGALFSHPVLDEYNFDHISEDRNAFPTGPSTVPTLSTPVPSGTSSTTTTIPPIQFSRLPSNVKTRYDDYQNGKLINYKTLEAKFIWEDTTQHKYYENNITAPQRVFINIGAIFHYPYVAKSFKKDPPICTDETPTGLRRWYNLFRNHSYAYGLYIPPYENIRLGMNHDGFEFGIDIPLHLQENQDIWRLDLHSVLQKAFSEKSSPNRLRIASTTNGFHALLAVIKPTHPLCHESPSAIIGDPPTQLDNEALPTFWARFYDQGILETVFLHGHFDPTSKHTLDRFLRKCTHGKYLLKATRDDRNDSSKQRDFEPSSLPLTLESYLARDDSPLQNTVPSTFPKVHTPYSRGQRSNRDSFRPFVKKIQALTASGDTDLPYSPRDLEEVLVHQLTQSDQRACLLCGDPHRFDTCHAFNDKKFVENFLIKIVSTVKGKLREATNLQRTHTPKSQDARVQQLVTDTVQTMLEVPTTPLPMESSQKPSPDSDATHQPSSDFG
jgi:hypothetical protein